MVPENAEMRLYGGAAFERVIDEFQQAASQLKVEAGGRLHTGHLKGWGHNCAGNLVVFDCIVRMHGRYVEETPSMTGGMHGRSAREECTGGM